MIQLLWELVIGLIDTTTRPWRKIFWFALHVYFTSWSILLTLLWRTLSAPFRILGAARREKLLEVQLQELQQHYEEISEKKGDLEKKLEVNVRDRKRIKDSLDQAVSEWERSIDRLKLLKARVQELEVQNARLKEVEREGKMLRLQMDGDMFKGVPDAENKVICEPFEFIEEDSMLAEGRGVALASSVFSAALSLVVGVIAWEAEDPCMPLVVALFTVVGMSLANVVKFFLRLQSRFGFDAVALLSFNWFMLGTLAFPAFPYIARFLSPFAVRIGLWIASWFGYSN